MFAFKRLQTKLFVLIVMLVLIPVAGLGVYSYFISTKSLEEQTIQNQSQTIQLVGNNIKSMLDDARDISGYVTTNETIQTLLNQPYSLSVTNSQKIMFDYLSNLKVAKKYISFMVIYGENDYMFRDFADYYRQVVSYNELKDSPVYMVTAARDGEAHLEYSSSPLFIYSHNYNEIMMGRRIISSYDPDKKLGMLFMGIKKDAMRNAIKDIQISKTTNLLLFDDNYHLIASKLDEKEMDAQLNDNLERKKQLSTSKETYIYTIGSKQYLASSAPIEPYNWYIVSLTPIEDIQKQHGIVLRITLILSLSLLLIVVIISALLSRSITSPIKNLLRSMNNFKRGDFNQNVEVISQDEIGLLTQKYNEMVIELNDLIQKVYVSQTNQKIIELRTLQTQIEPHFLYNTLDFIFFNSKMNGDDQTAQVVHALSELFRISFNRGNDYYKLEHEIKQIQAYVRIQHARFPNRFTAEFDIDPMIECFYTMKLLLQPIVENAILHAFDKKLNRPGILRITGVIETDHIRLTVEDNGCGMAPDQIEKLLTIPKHSTGGYGIRNVNERLQMMFGPDYALHISSAPNEGTIVSLRLPLVESEQKWRLLYENHGH
ncbi:HAMP domain-containing protein [Paenibacillus sp. LMG 31456]|uniref:histidine kinase n=1 Tax=Paenibacillus foliorum TaxID=2654974 RepID=A0A972JZC4_9BACL|nr:sensor histidine kinase [Paenibacillus foliorum]NOU91703.1 HAMP domain-containing protein [Paenibacillus foliorum]